jgi:hypothetical protein
MRGVGGMRGLRLSANEFSCAHGAQTNFGDLTPFLTYDLEERFYGFTIVK